MSGAEWGYGGLTCCTTENIPAVLNGVQLSTGTSLVVMLHVTWPSQAVSSKKKRPRMNSSLNIHQTVTFSEWRGMKVCGFNMFQMWQFWLFNIPVRKCVFLLHKIYHEQYIHLNSNKKFHYKWQLFLYIHFQWLLVWLILFQKQCSNLLSMFLTLR